jgi:hypothetical protein
MAGTRARAIIAGAIMLATAAGGVGTAGAATRQLVTGTATGEAPFIFGDGCGFVRQHFKATVQRPDSAAAHVDANVCAALSSVIDFDGTFVITTEQGTVRGTAHGTGTVSTGPLVTFAIDLHVTSVAPGVVAHVGEVLHFGGIWFSNSASGGPITGTVSDR